MDHLAALNRAALFMRPSSLPNLTRQQKNDLKPRAQRKRQYGNYDRFAREVACSECGVGFGPIAVDPDTCRPRDYFTLIEPGSEEKIDTYETLPNGTQILVEEDVVVRKQITLVPCTYMMTSNRDAILKTEARSNRREAA